MGKPSHPKSQRSRQNSTSAMGSHKKKKTKHRMQQNKQFSNKSVQKLFQNLRKENEVSTSEEYILNDSTSNITVISLDDTQPETSRKRKLHDEENKPKRTKLENSCILIKDDDQMKTPRKTSPINCSTPKSSLKSPSECDISNVCDLTKEINSKSYLTIDLTTETLDRTEQNTVIDLENSEKIDSNQNTVIDLDKTDADCSLVSVGVGSWSTESGVTVVKKTDSSKMRKIANGIANLNADEKGKLLELITQKIFNGCNVNSSSSTMLKNQPKQSRATETAEDTYIKEVILGQSQSRNSIGSNIYNPEKDAKNTPLRMVVIDGSNVAMEHGRGKFFSVKGLKICIEYFVKRGHVVKAFVPRFRCKFGKSTEPRLLASLERQGLVVYTPSREVQGKCIASYDDRYIVQCAAEFDGVIVSGDNYRDLLKENPRWRFVIENRLLPFTWVDDMLMFPKDPLGRNGPTLEQMLKKT